MNSVLLSAGIPPCRSALPGNCAGSGTINGAVSIAADGSECSPLPDQKLSFLGGLTNVVDLMKTTGV